MIKPVNKKGGEVSETNRDQKYRLLLRSYFFRIILA